MYLVVLITVPSRRVAKAITQAALKQKVAACVNVIPNVASVFWWQGKIDRAKELLLIVKTKRSLFARLAKVVKAHHPYEVPEIIALPIVKGHKRYLEWINESCR